MLAGCDRQAPPSTTTRPASEGETFGQGLQRIASTFSQAGEGKTIAVLEFPNLEDQTSNLSRFISERLTTELVRALMPRGRVVERRQVLQVLTERGLAQANLTSDQILQVGQLLGADAVVLGTLAVVGQNVVLNARLVTVPGGDVAAADLLDLPAPAEILALAQTGLPGPRLTPETTEPEGNPPLDLDTSSTPDSGVQTKSFPSPGSDPAAIKDLGDLTFRLLQCRGRGTSVLCAFTITATASDGTYRPGCGGTSRLYDETGQESSASHLVLAGQRITSWSEPTLVQGVITPGEYFFTNTRPAAQRISLLRLHFCSSGNNYTIEFRDLPIQR